MTHSDQDSGVFFGATYSKEGSQGEFEKGFREGLIQGYETGKQEGLEIGHRLGLDSAESKLRTSFELLQQATQEFSERQDLFFAQAKPELIRLAMETAKRIIRSELRAPKALQKQIQASIDDFYRKNNEGPIQVLLSPSDFESLSSYQDKWQSQGGKILFKADESVRPGDFIVRSDFALIHHQLDRIIEDLTIRVSEEA